MKPALFWTINVLCLVLGLALSIATRADDPARTSKAAGKHSPTDEASRISNRPHSVRTINSEKAKSTTRPADSWNELSAMTGLTSQERHDLRVEILRKWAATEPEAALRAALEMMRRDAICKGADPSLMDAFDEAMTADPDGFWELVKDERFSLQTGIARLHWIKTVGEAFPEILASHVQELTGNDVPRAVAAVLASPNQTQAAMDTWIQKMAGLPNTSANRVIFNEIGKALTEESFQTLLAQATNENYPGAAQIAKSAIVARFTLSNDPDQIRSQLALLPRSLQTEVINFAVGQIDRNPIAYTAIIDKVIQSGDWDLKAKEMCLNMHNMLGHGKDPIAVATWATKIPPEKRFEGLYRVGIRSYCQRTPAQAYEWIKALPAGWHQDNSLIEFINTSLHAHGKEDAALEAQKLIRDTSFRNESQALLNEWKNRR